MGPHGIESVVCCTCIDLHWSTLSAGFGVVVFRQSFNPPAERMSMVESKVLREMAPWYFQSSGLWNREVYVYLENVNQFTSATKLQAWISYYILTTFFSGFVQSKALWSRCWVVTSLFWDHNIYCHVALIPIIFTIHLGGHLPSSVKKLLHTDWL